MISTHIYKSSKSGIIHIIHKTTQQTICPFKVKPIGEEIIRPDKDKLCKFCLRTYNNFKGV